MQFLKKIFCQPGVKLFILVAPLFVFEGCHIGRIMVWNYADFDDYKKFDSRSITPKDHSSAFQFGMENPDEASAIAPQQIEIEGEKVDFDTFLRKKSTTAFLVIQNDQIYYEKYFNGYNQADKLPSFSIAKSFVSALIGIAIEEKAIGSVKDTVTQYLPELKDNGFDRVTIANLLNMRSGIAFEEGYKDPFSDVAKYYYGRNLQQYLSDLEVVKEPGKQTRYQSANTQLLAWILERTTGQSLSSYLSDKIAAPIGMQQPGTWSIDSEKHGMEKAFCCLNTTARNFARFGRLYLNNGKWGGETIIPPEWVENSTEVSGKPQNFEYFYQWWHCIDTRPVAEGYDSTMAGPFKKLKKAPNPEGEMEKYVVTPCSPYYARGFKGQYIYIAPEQDMMILRFGKTSGNFDWPSFFKSYAQSLDREQF